MTPKGLADYGAGSIGVAMRSRVRPHMGLVMVFIAGAVVSAPLLLLTINSFNVAPPTDAAEYGLENWATAFRSPGTAGAISNSFALSFARIGFSLPLALMLAWLIARTDLPGRGFIELACWIGVFLPVLPRVFGWILLLDPQFGIANAWVMRTLGLDAGPFNIYSFWGIVWVHIVSTTLYMQTVLLIPTFRRVGAALEEAARVCGASIIRTLRHITIPLLAPAVLGVAILAFVRALEAFEVELLLGTPVGLDVYATRIYHLVRLYDPQYGQATALGFLFLIVLMALALCYQFYMRGRQFTTVTGQGYSTHRVRLGRWRWVIAGIWYGYFAIALCVPMILLVVGSFMRRYGFFGLDDPYTLAHWRDVIGDAVFMTSFRNSLVIAGAATAIAIGLYSIIAYVLVHGRSRAHRAADLLMWVPWAVPGILLGLGLLWLYLGTPLRAVLHGTLGGIVAAIVIKESPLATMLFKAGLEQLGMELEESARVSGATRTGAYRKIVMPLIAPTAVTVGIIVFLFSISDISSVVLLYTASSRPLSILMLEYSFTGAMERGTVIGVLITVIVLSVTVAARRLGLRVTRDTG